MEIFLKELKNGYDKGLIDEELYNKKKNVLLKRL